MTQHIERGLIPRETRWIRVSEDSRLDAAAAVDALEEKIGIPLQVVRAEDVFRISGDDLDEPPD